MLGFGALGEHPLGIGEGFSPRPVPASRRVILIERGARRVLLTETGSNDGEI